MGEGLDKKRRRIANMPKMTPERLTRPRSDVTREANQLTDKLSADEEVLKQRHQRLTGLSKAPWLGR